MNVLREASPIQSTDYNMEIQDAKSVDEKYSVYSDGSSELQIDEKDADQEMHENGKMIVENAITNPQNFMAQNSTILSLLSKTTQQNASYSASPTNTTTPSNASDTGSYEDAKFSAIDLSTRKELISGSPSTSSITEQSGSHMPLPRSAGRKKTHPVWNFFKDLRDIDGVGSVICLHCDWKTDDRSPNNLRTHLKRSHDNEVYTKFLLMVSQTPTQPYVKRNRGANNNLNNVLAAAQNGAFDLSLQNLQSLQSLSQDAAIKQELNAMSLDPNSVTPQQLSQLFANIVRNVDLTAIDLNNIDPKNTDELKNNEVIAAYNAMLNMSMSSVINKSKPVQSTNEDTPTFNENTATAIVVEANALNEQLSSTLALAASNPLTWAIVSGDTSLLDRMKPSKSGSPSKNSPMKSSFSLSDPETLAAMLQAALELDLTFSCHGRRGQIEFCFESNRTAERSGGRGRQITLINNGGDIVVSEKVNGQITETETWLKTDLAQLMWAVRGKCQKSLHK